MSLEFDEFRIKVPRKISMDFEEAIEKIPSAEILEKQQIPTPWPEIDHKAHWNEELLQLTQRMGKLEDLMTFKPIETSYHVLNKRVNEWFLDNEWVFRQRIEIPMNRDFQMFIIGYLCDSQKAYQDQFPPPQTPYAQFSNKKTYLRLGDFLRPRGIRVFLDYFGLDDPQSISKNFAQIAQSEGIKEPSVKPLVK